MLIMLNTMTATQKDGELNTIDWKWILAITIVLHTNISVWFPAVLLYPDINTP